MSKNRPADGAERVKTLIIAAADKAPASLRPWIKHAATVVSTALVIWDRVSPFCISAFNGAVWAYNQLPDDLIPALFGLLLCFFGGTFAALIAAIEAFRMTGWEQTRESLSLLYEEFLVVKKKYDEDEKKDDDGDGVADVQQISPSALLARKTHLFLVSVKDPEKINTALTGICASCLSVVAVLRLEFAKTVTLGVSIANVMRTGAEYYVLPVLKTFTPQEYQQWLPTAVNYFCKSIAIAIAWYIQKVISAIHSAIRGGLMFSRNIFNYCNKKGYFAVKHEDSNLDEIIGWTVAAIGVYFQISYGFSLPFPLNLLLLPVTTLEWLIIWCVSDTSIQV